MMWVFTISESSPSDLMKPPWVIILVLKLLRPNLVSDKCNLGEIFFMFLLFFIRNCLSGEMLKVKDSWFNSMVFCELSVLLTMRRNFLVFGIRSLSSLSSLLSLSSLSSLMRIWRFYLILKLNYLSYLNFLNIGNFVLKL